MKKSDAFCKHGYHVVIRCFQCEVMKRVEKEADECKQTPIAPILLRNHALGQQIIEKITSGEIVMGTPIDDGFKWTEQRKNQLKEAVKTIRQLEE